MVETWYIVHTEKLAIWLGVAGKAAYGGRERPYTLSQGSVNQTGHPKYQSAQVMSVED